MEREKRTRAGPLLEVDFYPVFADGRRMPVRAKKSKPSTAEQAKYNQLMAAKKLVRLINENFGTTDYFAHLTYESSKAPQTEDDARRDITNYMRRIRTRRAQELKRLQKELAEAEDAAAELPGNAFLASAAEKIKAKIAKLGEPLKYAYVIEETVYRRGRYAGRSNWHFHLFVTGGVPIALMKSAWTEGIVNKFDCFDPATFGPEAAVIYMSKDPRGRKRFVCSRNMRKPDPPKTYDGKVTARAVERMAKERIDDRAYWERRYKGYRFVRCYARYNQYNGHWYVSVVMYKTDGAPPRWTADDWITSDYIT